MTASDVSTEVVRIGIHRVRVPVPQDWERLEPLPQVPLVAREPSGEWFRVNITVAADDTGYPSSAEVAGADLASHLPGGVLVDASRHDEDRSSYILTVAHVSNSRDVVTVQRQWRPGEVTLAVSYTCAVEQLPDWREHFERWLRQVEVATDSPSD